MENESKSKILVFLEKNWESIKFNIITLVLWIMFLNNREKINNFISQNGNEIINGFFTLIIPLVALLFMINVIKDQFSK